MEKKAFWAIMKPGAQTLAPRKRAQHCARTCNCSFEGSNALLQPTPMHKRVYTHTPTETNL